MVVRDDDGVDVWELVERDRRLGDPLWTRERQRGAPVAPHRVEQDPEPATTLPPLASSPLRVRIARRRGRELDEEARMPEPRRLQVVGPRAALGIGRERRGRGKVGLAPLREEVEGRDGVRLPRLVGVPERRGTAAGVLRADESTSERRAVFEDAEVEVQRGSDWRTTAEGVPRAP